MDGKWIVRVALGATMMALAWPAAAQAPDAASRQTESIFRQNDANKDGRLSREEFPEQMRRAFDRLDANGDGSVSREEDTAFRRKRLEQQGDRPRPAQPAALAPDFAEVKYGPHERNVFDLWKAKSEKPTPLVIYYHGGGFRGGDKRSVNPALLKRLLENGVSVAAANYRLTDAAPFPAQMHDCARALQFIRHKAAEYNLDPKRVGATGGSAGAGISEWLAFHEDLADPKSDDPVARQSTRLSVAVVYGAQTSYDPRFIKKLFDTDKMHEALVLLFGMERPEDVDDPKFHPLFEEASPINHVTKDDPPVLLFYSQENKPLPPNSTGGQHIHHPKFGILLKEKFDKLGIECQLELKEDNPQTPVEKYAQFFFKHLGVKAKAPDTAAKKSASGAGKARDDGRK